jgi:glutaredoxin
VTEAYVSLPCNPNIAGGVCMAVLMVLSATALAQDRQVYRYVDAEGRVVYSDRAPTGAAKDVQTKRVWGNTIETSGMPLVLQQATERFPVTLYTFACGDTCDKASALLNRRGVPYTVVDVEQAGNAEKLQQLTGELNAPVLQVGDKLIAKGFAEPQWNAMLDQAGYPKAPARRTTTPLGASKAADEPARSASAR